MTELQNEEINISDFTDPSQFNRQIQNLKDQLPSILDDFKKYYVFYNKNPEYPEYQTMFNNTKNNLNNLNSQLFIISNNVESKTDKLNKKLLELDILIKKEKEENRSLKRKLGIVEQKNDSTDEMIYNYKQTYDIEYLRNWGLFLSIIACGIAISKVYSTKSINSIS